MLAGEYGVIAGSEALTVPLELYYSRLAKKNSSTIQEKFASSVNALRELFSFIESLPRNSFYAFPEIQNQKEILKNEIYIESNIPQGYGIGSSGAVSALIYDQFFTGHESLSLQQQRKDLASLESHFHGKSSGVDAMSCFIGSSLHFLADGEIKIIESTPLRPPLDYRFFLLDSKIVFETAPLVKTFMEKMEDKNFRLLIEEEYSELIHKFIQTLIYEDQPDAGLLLRAISDFQWQNFREMIPEKMEDAWINGQVSNLYYLKLNGSGGGFMLGIAAKESKEMVEQMLKDFEIIWL
jgi:mevalonate kinase